jgi:hypothetical protein
VSRQEKTIENKKAYPYKESAKEMQRCHYFVMRGEIDGQLVKIAGLIEIHGEWTATPVRMEAIYICLII